MYAVESGVLLEKMNRSHHHLVLSELNVGFRRYWLESQQSQLVMSH